MKSLLTMVGILAGTCIVPAQNTFFTDFGAVQESGGRGKAIREVSDGYLIFSEQITFDSVPTYRTHLFVRKIDLNGQYLWGKDVTYGVDNDFNFGGGFAQAPLCTAPNGDFVSEVVEFNTDSIAIKTWFYRFDQQGDTLFRKLHLQGSNSDTLFLGGYQAVPTSDSGFAICGSYYEPGMQDAVATLLKTNELGDTLWFRQYPSSGVAYGIDENFDNGFLLTGRKSGQTWNGLFLIRTDSLGQELWRRWYGGYLDASQQVHLASDGNIVTWANHRTVWAPDAFDTVACRLTKWNQQGTVIDQGEYRMPYRPFTSDFEELPDGSWITMGKWGEMYRFNKFSASLDTVWTRTYWFFGGFHNLFDVEPTSDGGFIATGEAKQTGANNDPIPGLQTVTVLKLDSMGCLVPGCHTVGVQEIVLGLKDALRVWPNPASDHVNVQVSLPSGFEVHGDLVLEVQDALGREVLRSPLPGSGGGGPSPFSFQLSALPSGLYHLHLLDDTRVLTGTKLVKE